MENPKTPAYSKGEEVYWCGQKLATITKIIEPDKNGDYYYRIITNDGSKITAHTDELSKNNTEQT